MTVQLKEVYQPEVEQKMRNVYDSLSEKDRRRYAAVEVVKLGWVLETRLRWRGLCGAALRLQS